MNPDLEEESEQPRSSASPESRHDEVEPDKDDALLAELDGEISPTTKVKSTIGQWSKPEINSDQHGSPEYVVQKSVDKLAELYEKYNAQSGELERCEQSKSALEEQLQIAVKERNVLHSQIKDLNNKHCSVEAELERKMKELQSQCKVLQDRSLAQENFHKKSISDLQIKYSQQLQQIKRSTEVAHRDKDNAVIRYAQREKEILDLQIAKENLAKQLHQITTERDALSASLRGAKQDRTNIAAIRDQKLDEISDLRAEVERLKNHIAEADVRVKVANTRVEDIEGSHKKTKQELEQCQKKLKEAREETEAIRQSYKEVVQQYQENEDARVTSRDELNHGESSTSQHSSGLNSELQCLRAQHEDNLSAVEEYKLKLKNAEDMSSTTASLVSSLEETLKEKDVKIAELSLELKDFDQTKEKYQKQVERCKSLEENMALLKEEMDDCRNDANRCQRSTEEMLVLTQRLTEQSTLLQSQKENLEAKGESLESENEKLHTKCLQLETDLQSARSELEIIRTSTDNELQRLIQELSEKSKTAKDLQTRVDDEINQNHVLQRKHNATIKDLKSELSIMKRRLEVYESGTASQCSLSSGGGGPVAPGDSSPPTLNPAPERSHSRASSVSSMDALKQKHDVSNGKETESGSGVNHTRGVFENHISACACGQSNITGGLVVGSTNNSAQVGCEHNQKMIEKIVKLQRALARRNDKIEFLEEHVRQMLDEIKKKSRLIQNYALREETGSLAPESVDQNKLFGLTDKAQLARRGHSIMGSVFGGHGSDPQMTLELSLEINKKLQTVLEDALLKNITYKENLDTLGEQISALMAGPVKNCDSPAQQTTSPLL